MRVTATHDDVAAAHSVAHGGSILVSGSLVVARAACVGLISSKTMGPAIVHLDPFNINGERSNGSGGGDGSSIEHGCSVGAMIASHLCSEFVMAFLVSLGKVKLEVGESPISFIDFSPAFGGREEDTGLLEDFQHQS